MIGIENPLHLMFIGLIALLVLGPKRLPDVARAAGKGLREFRQALSGGLGERLSSLEEPDEQTHDG